MTPSSKIHTCGVIRFCYPASHGYRVEHADLAATRAHLYRQSYLEQRLAYLADVALASLRAQTDQDFGLTILVGDHLPSWALERLLDITARDENIMVLALPEGLKNKVATRRAFDHMRPNVDGPRLQFRHDDDDAVFTGFIATIKEMAEQNLDVLEAHDTITLDFPCGHKMMPLPDCVLAKYIKLGGFGVAIATLSRPQSTFSIFDIYHAQLVHQLPVVRNMRPRSFIRMQHFLNDSFNPLYRPERTMPLADPSKLTRLCRAMGLDPIKIRALGRYSAGTRPSL